MIKNYICIAWRNLLKNRLVSGINILGLTFGLASALLAILYAKNELSYEKCHEKADRISMVYLYGNMGSINWMPKTCGPEGKAIKDMFPEVELYSLQRLAEGIVKSGELVIQEDNIVFADSMFYSILTIPFIQGQPRFDPQSIALSEKSASKYFGKSNPLGKVLTINCLGEKMVFTVTGVYKDFQTNTEITADFIAPFSVAERYGWKYNDYQNTAYQTLVLTKPGLDIKKLNVKVASSLKIPIPIPEVKAVLMPLKEIHIRGTYENNYGKLIAFLIGGFFVLITSCFNYINLTNIVFSARIKEIGIRKVNGAGKTNVFIQFMFDNALATFFAFGFAVVIISSFLPWFNTLMDTQLNIAASVDFISIILILFLATTLLSGLLPALKYARLKPISLFQSSNNSIAGKNRSLWILTTIQFLFAVLFIQIMLIMSSQSKHLGDVNVLGYNSTDVICLPGNQWGDLNKVKAELLKSPDIVNVSWGSTIPEVDMSMTSNWKDDKNIESALQHKMEADYIKLFGIKMLEGRFFSEKFVSDHENAIVINRKTVHSLGLKHPLGMKMMAFGREYTIIGVIDSYQAIPLIFSEMPQIITLSKNSDRYLLIGIDPNNRRAAHEYITGLLKKINPDYPVDIKYHIDIIMDTAKTYISAEKLMRLFFLLSIITSLIGLFGLSVFIAEKSRKEISIRKICGATIQSILPQMLKGIFSQLLIAICIATPIAVLFSQQYLSMFSKHINPGILLFIEGGLIAMALTLITVILQSWKSATRNPVEALRYE